MTIDLYWENDAQTIMLAEFPPEWTWDDLFTMLDSVKKVTDRRDDSIGMILDVRQGTTLPGGSIFRPDTRNNARRLIQMNENGKGPVVILGANSFIRLIYATLGTLDKDAVRDVYFAETEEEAHEVLNRCLSACETVLQPE